IRPSGVKATAVGPVRPVERGRSSHPAGEVTAPAEAAQHAIATRTEASATAKRLVVESNFIARAPRRGKYQPKHESPDGKRGGRQIPGNSQCPDRRSSGVDAALRPRSERGVGAGGGARRA